MDWQICTLEVASGHTSCREPKNFGSCNTTPSLAYSGAEPKIAMQHASRRSHQPQHRLRLGFLALLLVPLLLFLHAPVLAALVPGALITMASLDALQQRDARALPAAQIVGADDILDLQRVAAATTIEARHQRVDRPLARTVAVQRGA